MKSMTAFARVSFSAMGADYSLEIRSVNNRFREVSMRLPSPLNELEDKIKNTISADVHRGRVNVTVSREATAQQPAEVEVNLELARGYHGALTRLKSELGLAGEVDMILMSGLSDIFSVRWPKMEEEQLWSLFEPVLKETLGQFVAMREREGATLKQDIAARIDIIEEMLARTEAIKDTVVSDYAMRLKERAQRLLNGIEIDDQRFLTEVALLAERSDITEELVRAGSHLNQFRALLREKEPVGRKADFLVQELNREVNTIGSKANSADIAQLVVGAKGELEKIREQIQNIE